jgi:phosphopantothenate---cysteine ligase (CTP)
MICVVTAGPTYEPLDEVRRLTNFSTGQLGMELANYLSGIGHEVHLLRGYYSTFRQEPPVGRIQVFTTTCDLSLHLEKMAGDTVGAVFHAAAVSDFTFGKIFERGPEGRLIEVQVKKVSTRTGELLAELLPAPKIIRQLRGWFPRAFLVGWKYELDGSREDVIARAAAQVRENQTDVCVANGAAYGRGFGIVTAGGDCEHLANKELLLSRLSARLRGPKTPS